MPRGFKDRLKSVIGMGAKDIQLPNESGRVDPRLKKPDVGAALKRAVEGYKALPSFGKRKK